MLAKRWAWVILLGVVICGSLTYVVTKLMHPVYQASALLFLSTNTSQSTLDNTSAVLAALPTYAQLVTHPTVLEPVLAKHKGLTLQQLTAMVTVKPQSNSQLIEVDVENSDPRLATQLANDISQSFAVYSNTHLGGVMQIQPLPAQQPIDPVRPKPSLDALIGALVGLGLALALIIIFEWSDDHMVRTEEIQELLGLETLTAIPELSRKQRRKNAEETPVLAEGCRILCANLNAMQAVKPFKLIMVTSALAGEGKSTIATNIASFLAMAGKRVLLVDADLRHPVQDQHFLFDNHLGLSNAISEIWGRVAVDLEGQPTEIPTLRVMTAGTLQPNPTELLQSPLAHQLFTHFRESQQFDYIILDTAPLLPIADTRILASYVQATVLVVDASKTPRKILVRAKQALSKTSTRILGVALNKSYWSDYGDIREYLGNTQQQSSKAGINMVMPPNTPPETPSTDGNGDDPSITVTLRQKQAGNV